MSTRRFQPYESVSGARFDKYRDTEAGPATLVPSPIRHSTPQIRRHSRRTSKATADAEIDQTVAEEDEVTVSSFTVLIFLM